MRWMVLGLAAAALAACGEGEGNEAAADANAVGFVPPAVISRLDWGSRQERFFSDLDRNGDDRLTKDEWPRATSRLVLYDANKDGEVTKGEFSEGSIARFDRMDLNKDGTVTSEEQDTSRNGALAAD